MGVEGIYLEDDRETIYAGSVIMAPSSYRGKGPGSIIYVNNPGIYNEPIIIGNGDPSKIGGLCPSFVLLSQLAVVLVGIFIFVLQ